jgi:hypothetical protein
LIHSQQIPQNNNRFSKNTKLSTNHGGERERERGERFVALDWSELKWVSRFALHRTARSPSGNIAVEDIVIERERERERERVCAEMREKRKNNFFILNNYV